MREKRVLPRSAETTTPRGIDQIASRISGNFGARAIEGWPYKQLASALNLPAATVVSRLIQARRRLRQEVAGIQTYGVT